MRNWKQRLCSLLLCGAMLASLCPTALAEEEDGTQETYIALTWDGSKLVKDTPPVPADITEITAENVEDLALDETDGGWYIVRNNGVSRDYAIFVTGTVHLILADGCSLDVTSIILEENSNLSIYAQSDDENMGELTAHYSSYNAGIEVHAGSTVTIHGGRVTATSSYGAGIGGGERGEGGEITISGGTVTVQSDRGADIGGGYDSNYDIIVPSDKIEISGGTVTRPGGGELNIGSATHRAKEDEWLSDSTHHWYPCTVADCDKNHQFNKDLHTPGDWIVDQAATSSTAGSQHKECAVCGYTMQTETIPPIEPPDPVDPPYGGGGYTPPTYKPDVTQPDEGGTVSVTPSRPERGDTVTVKPKPDEGYELDSVTVTDRDGKSVEVTAKPNGTYTFKQPAGKVKIEVSYKPIETPWNNPFADVSEGDWYYEAVRFVQEQGLMSGYSDGRFGAEDTLSRSQLAQILFNKEGRPVVNYLLQYGDVSTGTWYTEAVRWAASQGVVSGYGDGTFGPDDPITREQLAVMLWRYSGSPAATNEELHFNDESQISGYALEALRWAVENGILNGDGERLGPQDQATRAQAAQMLKSFIDHQEEDI